MALSRGAKKGYEAESLAPKLLFPQAVSAEPARGSHQYRATHRNCEEGWSCRADGCLWAMEKSSAWCCCTFGAKTNVIGFGFGGTQVAVA